MSKVGNRKWEKVCADALRVARGYMTLDQLVEAHKLDHEGADRAQINAYAKKLEDMHEPRGDLAADVLRQLVPKRPRGAKKVDLFAALAAVEEPAKPAKRTAKRS